MRDLHTLYHPPTTLLPLQVDTGKPGKDSDHNIVVFAPKHNIQYTSEEAKTTVRTRPLPDSKIYKFEKELMKYQWEKLFEGKTVDKQVETFHGVLRDILEEHFPEKITKFSNLDKKWMSPQLKQLHRAMQREFYKNRKSSKQKNLKSKFKKLKKKLIRSVYTDFVHDLKSMDPAKWYSMAKKIGAVNTIGSNTKVESISHLSNKECANRIAEHFYAISLEYSPVDYTQLP